MRTLLAAVLFLALSLPASAAPATSSDGERPSPWSGQIGAGVDLWVPTFVPLLWGAFTHDDVPIWLDLRVGWEPSSRFGMAELGVVNRLLPASRMAPVWTARWGVVANRTREAWNTAVIVTSGFGLSWRISDAVSFQLATELSASPSFRFPFPRINSLVNVHF